MGCLIRVVTVSSNSLVLTATSVSELLALKKKKKVVGIPVAFAKKSHSSEVERRTLVNVAEIRFCLSFLWQLRLFVL